MLAAPIPPNESERIASLRRMLLLASPDEESFDRVTRAAQRMFNVPIALVSLIDANRQWFKSCIGLPVRETPRDISFCGHAILERSLFVIEDARADARFADNPLVTGEPHVVFYAGRPLRNAENFLVGTLCIIDHHARQFNDLDRRTLDDLGYWVEQIFYGRELSEAQHAVLSELDEVRRSAMLDPMLNVWHRGAIDQMLEQEVLRAFRTKTPLSVLMIDVDKFKQINDVYGHPAGDAVLIEFAKRLRSVTRPYDSLGRYGGDEFMVVLPDAEAAVAVDVAARLLLAMRSPVMVGDVALNVTVSVGVGSADFVSDAPEAPQLLLRADTALLEAKRLGRDRIEVCTGPVNTPGAPLTRT
jgi:diguanylate cyclase (GGDEF)-like protein